MDDSANKAYFKSQGWPTMMNGDPKPIGRLDTGELIAVARKYAVVLQTEFRQITKAPDRNSAEAAAFARGLAATPPGVKLMQSHAPAALAGIYFEEAAKIEPAALLGPDSLLPPEPTRAKRGHGPRKIKLTPAMIHYMTAVERDGSGAWDRGAGRAGGAVSRMWDRLVAAGLATPPPRKLTAAGRAALKAVPIKHQRITPAAIQRMARGNHNRSSR